MVASVILLTACSLQSDPNKPGAGDPVLPSQSTTGVSKGAYQPADGENTKAAGTSDMEDTDIGLKNIKIDDEKENLTDDQKLVVEYFDNDYFYLYNHNAFEFLQRYPGVFKDSQINLSGVVKKVLSYNEEEYKLLLQLADGEYYYNFWDGAEDYGTYLDKRKNNFVVLTGKSGDSRLIEGDYINIFGRYNNVETVEVDSASFVVPLINTFRADIIPAEYIHGAYKFTPNYVKKVAKVIFGNDIEVRNPTGEEDTDLEPPVFMIVEPENQSNSKFTKFRMWMLREGRLEDGKEDFAGSSDYTGIIRSFEFTPDLNNFIVVTNDPKQKNLNIDYYDKDLNKIWNREFEDTTSVAYDYTKSNFYLIANNELFILDLNTGQNKANPVYVGKKIEIRKLKDGLLVIGQEQSDAIMKLGLDGSILWKANLNYNILSVDNVQFNENIVISINPESYEGEDHYLVIDSDTGEIIIDAASKKQTAQEPSTPTPATAASSSANTPPKASGSRPPSSTVPSATEPNGNGTDVYEVENNGMPSRANRIPFDAMITANLLGHWRDNEQDWFQFTVPTGKYGAVQFFTLNQGDSKNYWDIYIYRSSDIDLMPVTAKLDDMVPIFQAYINGRREVSTFDGLGSGSYYIRIESSTVFSSDNYGLSVQSSRLSQEGVNGLVIPNGFESEDNNSSAKADHIAVNTRITGSLSGHWRDKERDWFKFTVPGNSKAEVHLLTSEQTTASNYWDIYLYRKSDIDSMPKGGKLNDLTPIFHKYVSGKVTDTAISNIGAGSYYIRVETSTIHSFDQYSIEIID